MSLIWNNEPLEYVLISDINPDPIDFVGLESLFSFHKEVVENSLVASKNAEQISQLTLLAAF